MDKKGIEKLPIIGITMGDPAGVGPEIIIKALAKGQDRWRYIPVVLGDIGVLRQAAKVVGWRGRFRSIEDPQEARRLPGCIHILRPRGLTEGPFESGRQSTEGGRAAALCIEQAVALALRGEIAAVVTCPISKAMLNRAGYDFQGHTQMIADLTGCDSYVMMLAGDRLMVSLVTIHVPLSQVPKLITEGRVYKTICITHEALMRDFSLSRARIGVAALNPHGGEEGLFGKEEEKIILPAIQRAKSKGVNVEGPFPADTLFWRASEGEFDAVVAMYHDQGLAPLKLAHFYDAVNVTLGLPIVRTSPDHGTAYDLAGTGRANHTSLVNALELAVRIANNRKGQVDKQQSNG